MQLNEVLVQWNIYKIFFFFFFFFRWFVHLERKKCEEFVKKLNVSEINGSWRRGRPVVRWKDTVKEYMHERGADREQGLEQ